MTLTLTILLGFFLAAALILAIALAYLERQKWMRMFSVQQGIPIPSMEGRPEKPAEPAAAVPHKAQRRKFSMPVPLGAAESMRKDAREP